MTGISTRVRQVAVSYPGHVTAAVAAFTTGNPNRYLKAAVDKLELSLVVWWSFPRRN
ncbi:hypothetical protein ANO14919_141270 [Xylariales sp. No.14919]|nr:hypothetical protein ANO14919_141270 [Xylariales sp. No.14919]